MFYDDKSIGAGYRPKVFLRKSSVGSRDIPQDVSVRQSLAVLPLVRRHDVTFILFVPFSTWKALQKLNRTIHSSFIPL